MITIKIKEELFDVCDLTTVLGKKGLYNLQGIEKIEITRIPDDRNGLFLIELELQIPNE